MNINEIGAKTGHCCECEAPMSMDSRTIKDNIRETTEQLHIIEEVIDTTFSYDNAILALPDGSVVSGKIESWKDYDDGDQIQVKIDGTTYLVHSVNIVLIKE